MAENENAKGKWGLEFIQKTPCARASLMLGISSGIALGALVFLKTKKVRRSCDYAVGSFALVSLASWEICTYQRYKERERIKKAVNLLNEYEKKKTQGFDSELTET